MSAHTYAQPSDVYRVSGLGSLAFVSRARPIDPRAGDSVDPTTGTFSLIGHGYETGERVRLIVNGTGYVPINATAGLPYEVVKVDTWRFQIRPVGGGSVLTFADAGSGAWGVQGDPEPKILRVAQDCTAIVDECLTAHRAPLMVDDHGAYPEIVIGVVARMTARRYLPTLQGENPAVRVALDRLNASAAFDGDTDPPAREGSLLGDWKRGKPVYPTPIDQNSVSDIGARAKDRNSAPRPRIAWQKGCI